MRFCYLVNRPKTRLLGTKDFIFTLCKVIFISGSVVQVHISDL